MGYFGQQGWLSVGIVLCFLLGIGCQLSVGFFWKKLVNESKRLEQEKPRLLRSWLEEYIKEEGQISNKEAFVDKGLQEFKVGRFTLIQLNHLSGQVLFLGIFLSGVGASRGIIMGATLGQLLPFYLIALLGMYLYFSFSEMVAAEEKKEIVKTNLLDFLENHQPYFWGVSRQEKEKQIETVEQKEECLFGEQDEIQLKELLKEILA